MSQTGAQERMKFFTEMALAMIGGHFGKEVEAEGDEILGVQLQPIRFTIIDRCFRFKKQIIQIHLSLDSMRMTDNEYRFLSICTRKHGRSRCGTKTEPPIPCAP